VSDVHDATKAKLQPPHPSVVIPGPFEDPIPTPDGASVRLVFFLNVYWEGKALQ
jgi:hypothetical protein